MLPGAVIVAALCACFAATSAQGVSESCRLTTGGAGVCLEYDACPVVAMSFPRFKPNFCGRRGRVAIVCCPEGRGNVLDISPPAVNFECGGGGSEKSRVDLRVQANMAARAGVAALEDFRRFVVNGFDAGVGAWPWMALLGEEDTTGFKDWFCSGVLINDRWILTAAHCFERAVNVLRLGEHDTTKTSEAQHEDLVVGDPVLHPDYQDPIAYHDLALLKLPRKVQLRPHVHPVCLPWGPASAKDITNSWLTITGWGDTQDGGSRSSILQEAQVTVFPASRCDRDYQTLMATYGTLWPNGIANETICAGDELNGSDACRGDSGGPAVHQGDGGRWTLAGIISKGHGCGLHNYPGLYVNLHQPQYLAWIKNVAF